MSIILHSSTFFAFVQSSFFLQYHSFFLSPFFLDFQIPFLLTLFLFRHLRSFTFNSPSIFFSNIPFPPFVINICFFLSFLIPLLFVLLFPLLSFCLILIFLSCFLQLSISLFSSLYNFFVPSSSFLHCHHNHLHTILLILFLLPSSFIYPSISLYATYFLSTTF